VTLRSSGSIIGMTLTMWVVVCHPKDFDGSWIASAVAQGRDVRWLVRANGMTIKNTPLFQWEDS
jgi:hypothetical protein